MKAILFFQVSARTKIYRLATDDKYCASRQIPVTTLSRSELRLRVLQFSCV